MLEDKRFDETNNLSRRDFLVKAGALTAGMAVAGGIFGSMASESAAATNVPIPYAKLDIDAVREYAFDGYKSGNGCCYGAAHGLLSVLKSQRDYDTRWDVFDSSLFWYGLGGVSGWGTLCGALNGALYVMALAVGWKDTKYTEALAADKKDYGKTMSKYGNELISWYCKFPFPTPALAKGTVLNAIPSTRATAAQITSVAGSPLCHNSVSTWCKATEQEPYNLFEKVNGKAKGDRCARLTADVAAKAATILNQHLTGTYKAAAKNTVETNYCMTCHAPGNVPQDSAGNFLEGYKKPSSFQKDDEQGKMPCVECHTDEVAHKDNMNPTLNATADRCDTCHTY